MNTISVAYCVHTCEVMHQSITGNAGQHFQKYEEDLGEIHCV